MVDELMERRALELTIRTAEAEEHMLEQRLEHVALDQVRTRRSIAAALHDEPWRRFAA
jgi:hypothetical protein